MNKFITPIALSALLALPAVAGETTTQTYTQNTPESSPMWSWFAGGSVAYLFEYDEPMYLLNVGVSSPWSPLGFSTSFFLEGGYMDDDNESEIPLGISGLDTDLEIVPVTANVQFEKAFNDTIGIYFGGGVGAAFADLKAAGIGHEHDTVFTGQVFAGVNYHLGDRSEIYTGGRWIHFDDADNYDLDSTWAAELGYRFKF